MQKEKKKRKNPKRDNSSLKKTVIILSVILVISGTFYVWHQNRKSNHRQRMTKVEDFQQHSVATFAGGCFWCSESDFEKTYGVIEAISGYTGGEAENPAYKDVASGKTGHREAVQVFFNHDKVSYEQLLDVYWRHINPTDGGGQFADRGKQYSPAIFFHDDEQKVAAEESKKLMDKSGLLERPVATPIIFFKEFFVAEDYHQDYHKKNSIQYKFYRDGSGRDDFIKKTYGNTLFGAQNHHRCKLEGKESVCKEEKYTVPTDEELKKRLTKLQYNVTQNDATERAFDNEYWNNHEEGVYVDIVSGEPLFSSRDKFDSGTGWPSFLRPIEDGVVTEHDDYKLLYKRIEIRSKIADSHLGHIIFDGPESNDKIRYCMNSAALRFISKDNLVKEGYGEFDSLFE